MCNVFSGYKKLLFDLVIIIFANLVFIYLNEDNINKELIVLIINSFTYIMFFGLFKIQKRILKYTDLQDQFLIIKACSISLLTSNVLLILIFRNMFLRFTLLFYILFLFLELISRGFVRKIYEYLKFQKSNGNSTRIMIIGAGDAGSMIVGDLLKKPTLYKPILILDDDKGKEGSFVLGIPVYYNTSKLEYYTRQNDIQEIIIAIPTLNSKKLRQLIEFSQKTNCIIRTLPQKTSLLSDVVTINETRDIRIEDLLGRDERILDELSISETFYNKVILVTGGGGSIGSELIRQLLKFKPKSVILLDNYENNAFTLQQELLQINSNTEIKVVIASIREKDRLDYIFSKYTPNIVFHAAAHKHVPLMEENNIEAVRNNILGTYNIAEVAIKNKVEKCILISTDKAVNPTNLMGATKRIAELIFQSFNFKGNTEFVAVRFGNVLGSNGSVIPTFLNQIKLGGPVKVTHPEITRYFMTIPEASRLVIQAASMANGGEIYILDMGEPVKIVELAEKLINLSGFIPYRDIQIEFMGLRPGEKLYEELIEKNEDFSLTKQDGIFIARPTDIDVVLLENLITQLRELKPEQEEKIRKLVKSVVVNYNYKGEI